jgi:hypothetical protein
MLKGISQTNVEENMIAYSFRNWNEDRFSKAVACSLGDYILVE